VNVCGIDVSAKELFVVVHRGERVQALRQFANTPAGHKQLIDYLLGRRREPIRVCLEASGNYSLDVSLALAARSEIELQVLNPRVARRFGQALDERSKTDPIDTHGLAEYAKRMPFVRWEPPREQDLQLRAITRQMTALTQDRAALRCRLHAATVAQGAPACVARELKLAIAQLERSLARLRRVALKLVAQDPSLQRRLELLQSAPGIGQATGLTVLGELVIVGDRSARELTKHAGLDVVEFSSGTSVRKRPHISRAGNTYLRKALYMSALSAAHHEPYLRGFYQRLVSAGKHKMQALTAVMRKLLHAIVGMFKHDRPYDGALLCPPATAKGAQAPTA
jgi:transposase